MALDPTRPFTVRMARGEIPWSTIRGPKFRKLLPTVYVASETRVTPMLMAEAAMLVVPSTGWPVDLCYLDLKLVIEYDGQQHRSEDLDQWDRDNDRLSWFARRGWELVPVISRGIYRRPEETPARACDAIRRRGGVVPDLAPTWRLYFPGDGTSEPDPVAATG